jgi:hypothetical protein
MVSHSLDGADRTGKTPFVLPAAGTSNLKSDDISSVVAFEANKVGIMWSNQNDSAMYFFAYHRDGLDGVACRRQQRRQQRPVHQAERHATDRNRGIRLERDDVLLLAQRRAHPLTSQDSGRTLAPGGSPRLKLVGTGPAARHTWEAVLPTDPTVSVFQTPAWLDAICAATSYEDATCEYRTEDGRSVVLPIVRRGCPAGSRSRAPCPLAAVRAGSYRATA